MKRITVFVLCVLFLTTTVLAVEDIPVDTGHFSDVSSQSPHFTAIEAMTDVGIIGGIGNGQFAPDRLISGAELQIMLSRAYTTETLDGQLSEAQLALYNSTTVSWRAATDIAFQVAGIYVYSYTLLDNPVYLNDTMDAAVMMGLYNGYFPGPDASLTRAEYCSFLYRLMNAKENPTPAALSRIKHIRIEDSAATYELRNMAAKEATGIPDHMMALLNDQGYTLVFSNTLSKYTDVVYPSNVYVGGFTIIKSGVKEIILFPGPRGYTSLYHELGHAVSDAYGFDKCDALINIWRNDVQGAIKLTTSSAGQNPEECWAEAFGYLLSNRGDANKMAAARALIPASYSYFQQIMDLSSVEAATDAG